MKRAYASDTESATENIPPRSRGVRVKRCGPDASGIKVRAHRPGGDNGGTANPTRSKTK